jgi:hypothetical protein
MNVATRKYEWIKEQINAGRTVYLSTYTGATKLQAKHLPQLRVRGDNLEVQHGNKWLNHNYSKLSAA